MFCRFRKTESRRVPFRRILAGASIVLASLWLGGCATLDLQGESFPRDETFQWSGRVRPPDSSVECFGFSNRAKQIEQDFGAR